MSGERPSGQREHDIDRQRVGTWLMVSLLLLIQVPSAVWLPRVFEAFGWFYGALITAGVALVAGLLMRGIIRYIGRG